MFADEITMIGCYFFVSTLSPLHTKFLFPSKAFCGFQNQLLIYNPKREPLDLKLSRKVHLSALIVLSLNPPLEGWRVNGTRLRLCQCLRMYKTGLYYK